MKLPVMTQAGCIRYTGIHARACFPQVRVGSVTVAELTQWALDLPPEERLALAEILWKSLEQEPAGSLHRKKRHAEIALFAREHAGTPVDLDPELEYEVRDRGDHGLLRQADELPKTTLEDLVGCTGYAGPAWTLEDMKARVARGARESPWSPKTSRR